MSANGVVFRPLVLLIILVPWPLASDRPLGWAVLGLVVAVLLGVWSLLAAVGTPRTGLAMRPLLFVVVPMLAALAWAAAQLSGLTPTAWASPLWVEAQAVLGGETGAAISVDPDLGWLALMRSVTYAAVFFLAVQLCRRGHRAEAGVRAVALTATAAALWGLGVYATGNSTVLWYDKWAYQQDLTGPFVNRNAFGAYLGLGLLACLAVMLDRLSALPMRRGRAREAAERVLLEALPWLLPIAVLATALLLTHSRGAFLATSLAAAVMLVVAMGSGLLGRWIGGLVILLIFVGAGGLLVSAGDVTLTRLIEQAELEGDRGNLFRLTLNAIAAAPWLGWGHGSFASAFLIYRDLGLPRPVFYDFAHSMPLEMLMDLGIPAAAMMMLSLLSAGVICAIGVVRRQRRQHLPLLGLGVLLLISLHAAVDFPAQNPAVAITFAFLLGLGVAQSFSSQRQLEEDAPISAVGEPGETPPDPPR